MVKIVVIVKKYKRSLQELTGNMSDSIKIKYI